MKNKLPDFRGLGRAILTIVSGREEAPLAVHLQRAMPLLLPCVGAVALLAWNFAWRGPKMRAERAVFRPLVGLEAEIAQRQFAHSEQQTVELRERSAAAAKLLIENPAALATQLAELVKAAAALGWEATFQPELSSGDPPSPSEQITLLPVRAKLSPAAGNADPFPSLLAMLEGFSASEKRIDVTRLTIRSEARPWQIIELSLRLAAPVPHAKTF